jgi:2-keto-3-deoxy-L-rhamnonate aldolase RhmA
MRSGPPGALLLGYNDAAPNGGNMIDVWDRAGVIIQIESKVGAENAQAIAAVEGGE